MIAGAMKIHYKWCLSFGYDLKILEKESEKLHVFKRAIFEASDSRSWLIRIENVVSGVRKKSVIENVVSGVRCLVSEKNLTPEH